MAVRFKCMQRVENEQGWTLVLQASATDGSPENKLFFAGPAGNQAGGGTLQLSMVADAVAASFKPGKTYALELSEVAQ